MYDPRMMQPGGVNALQQMLMQTMLQRDQQPPPLSIPPQGGGGPPQFQLSGTQPMTNAVGAAPTNQPPLLRSPQMTALAGATPATQSPMSGPSPIQMQRVQPQLPPIGGTPPPEPMQAQQAAQPPQPMPQQQQQAPQPQAQPPMGGQGAPGGGAMQNPFVMDLLANLLRGGGMGGYMGGGAPLGGGGYMGMQPSGFGGYMGGAATNPMMGSPWGGQSPMMGQMSGIQQNPMFSYLMDLFQQSRPPAGGFAQNQPQAPPIQPQVPQAPMAPQGPPPRRLGGWENRAGGI